MDLWIHATFLHKEFAHIKLKILAGLRCRRFSMKWMTCRNTKYLFQSIRYVLFIFHFLQRSAGWLWRGVVPRAWCSVAWCKLNILSFETFFSYLAWCFHEMRTKRIHHSGEMTNGPHNFFLIIWLVDNETNEVNEKQNVGSRILWSLEKADKMGKTFRFYGVAKQQARRNIRGKWSVSKCYIFIQWVGWVRVW